MCSYRYHVRVKLWMSNLLSQVSCCMRVAPWNGYCRQENTNAEKTHKTFVKAQSKIPRMVFHRMLSALSLNSLAKFHL